MPSKLMLLHCHRRSSIGDMSTGSCTKVNNDSVVAAPEIFSLPDIIVCENAAMVLTKLSLSSSGEDRQSCAHIDAPYALDRPCNISSYYQRREASNTLYHARII
mmetsp:Transcript_56173/g.99290  ORF Transcript_56173/g.99290 Transcript_56173/m.99290 type:complete len:104 (+) Transcript_56173:290-601(+)